MGKSLKTNSSVGARSRHELCISGAGVQSVAIRKTDSGFALLDLIFVCGLIGILSGIAVPKLLLAKQAAGAASAIGSMRAINSAELTYALTCGSGFYAPNLPSLGHAPTGSNEPFLSPDLTSSNSVVKAGYIVQLTADPFGGSPASCNGVAAGEGGQGFRAAADPTDLTNLRYFGINSYGLIYEDVTTMFPVMPELGEPAAGHPLLR
jgi:type II secretory pathway pseudopilin PulG